MKRAACVVENVADLRAIADELGAGRLDVVYDEVQPVGRAGRGIGDSCAKDDRAWRPRRGQLYHPKVIVDDEIGVQPSAQPHVELLGPVHVGNRQHHDLKSHVHRQGSYSEGRQRLSPMVAVKSGEACPTKP